MDVAKHIHALGWPKTNAWKMLRSLPPYAMRRIAEGMNLASANAMQRRFIRPQGRNALA